MYEDERRRASSLEAQLKEVADSYTQLQALTVMGTSTTTVDTLSSEVVEEVAIVANDVALSNLVENDIQLVDTLSSESIVSLNPVDVQVVDLISTVNDYNSTEEASEMVVFIDDLHKHNLFSHLFIALVFSTVIGSCIVIVSVFVFVKDKVVVQESASVSVLEPATESVETVTTVVTPSQALGPIVSASSTSLTPERQPATKKTPIVIIDLVEDSAPSSPTIPSDTTPFTSVPRVIEPVQEVSDTSDTDTSLITIADKRKKDNDDDKKVDEGELTSKKQRVAGDATSPTTITTTSASSSSSSSSSEVIVPSRSEVTVPPQEVVSGTSSKQQPAKKRKNDNDDSSKGT